MKGVSMIRVTLQPHAYCLGTEGGEDGGPCPFQRHGSWTVTAATVRSEAQRHVKDTGHTVLVDILDRTDYAPEPVRAGEPS